MVICEEKMCSSDRADDMVGCSMGLSKSYFRSRKGQLSNIVVIEVNKKNLNTVWPYLLSCIRNASFLSLDLELTGLGIQKGWLAKSLQERYEVIRQSAQTRSVLSVGITTFQLLNRKVTDTKKKIKYKCQVFNILTLCTEPFVVEPDGLQFLSKHRFDFNRWINLGIPYDEKTEKGSTLITLWCEILSAAVPITFHNGLVDLVFIYQHFYSSLPETFTEFVANISDWFLLPENAPGLYDSKYIAEYIVRLKGSFLEYVFRKCQRENAIEQAQNRLYISVEFDFTMAETYLKEFIDIVDCKLPVGFDANAMTEHWPISEEQKNALCRRYANYGFCRSKDCPFLHNVDILLSIEEQKQAKVRERRKRRYDYESKLGKPRSMNEINEEMSVSTRSSNEEGSDDTVKDHSVSPKISTRDESAKVPVDVAQNETNSQQSITGCHRAGVDSFMTGFAVIFMQRMNLLRTGNFDKECGNCVALPGMTVPMIIHRSDYVKSADDHIAKWMKIESERKRRASIEQQIKAVATKD